jgi:hypothetical protein
MNTTTTKKYIRTRVRIPVEEIERPKQHLSFIQFLKLYIEKENAGENHFKWMSIAMVSQAIIITPFIALIIMITGNWIPLWFVATASMFVSFIPALSGLRTKKILGIYLFNQVISVLLIATAILYFYIYNH